MIRDRFQQFTHIARDLLSDFREVEQNFRLLDRSVRERIAFWEGGKAALLDEIMGRKDAIDDSDQGRCFRAFWDFLMSDSRQQELTNLLDTILEHSAVAATEPDPRLRRVHYCLCGIAYYPSAMTTVTVKLPDPLSRALAREAIARGVSKSEVIRASLQQQLTDQGGDDEGPSCLDLVADLVGIFDGPTDASSNPKYLTEALKKDHNRGKKRNH